MDTNVLHCGDNLTIMQGMEDECVDLIYLDPPFFTQKDWGDFDDHFESMDDYISWLRIRMLYARRLLKPTGSIYLHCDWHAAHYVKVMMDEIFGYKNFRNEIIWYYPGRGGAGNQFSRKHDNILYYSKTNSWTFNKKDVAIEPDPKAIDPKRFAKNDIRRKDPSKINTVGKCPESVWDKFPILKGKSKERLGYPTQKPEALLERIIKASSNPGDIVLDPFCGSGTSIVAAHTIGRRYIGIDRNPRAIEICRSRLDVPVQQTL